MKQIYEDEILPRQEAAHAEYLEYAREVALRLGEIKDEVTINDVRDIAPPPPDIDGRIMGAVFLRKDWELKRHERSHRRTCHNRPVGVFTLRAR